MGISTLKDNYLTLLLILFMCSPLLATDYTWSVPSGRWNDAVNWAPNGVPGAGDRAIVTSGAVVLIGDVTVDQLELSNGEVSTNNGSALRVDREFRWEGGTLGCDLTLSFGGQAIFAGGTKTLREGQLSLNGDTEHSSGDLIVSLDPAEVVNSATYRLGGGTIQLSEYNRSFINGGLFELLTDGELTRGAGIFVNALGATFTKSSGSGRMMVGSRFGQAGSFNHLAGDSLVFLDTLLALSPIPLNNNGILKTAAFTAQTVLTFTAGQSWVVGGATDISQPLQVPGNLVLLPGGRLTSAFDVAVTGFLDLRGGALQATTIVNQGALGRIDGNVSVEAPFVNRGTMNHIADTLALSGAAFANTGVYNAGGAGALTLDPTANFINDGDFMVFSDDFLLSGPGGSSGGGTFTNNSTYALKQTPNDGPARVLCSFDNQGTIVNEVDGGILHFYALLQAGTLDFSTVAGRLETLNATFSAPLGLEADDQWYAYRTAEINLSFAVDCFWENYADLSGSGQVIVNELTYWRDGEIALPLTVNDELFVVFPVRTPMELAASTHVSATGYFFSASPLVLGAGDTLLNDGIFFLNSSIDLTGATTYFHNKGTITNSELSFQTAFVGNGRFRNVGTWENNTSLAQMIVDCVTESPGSILSPQAVIFVVRDSLYLDGPLSVERSFNLIASAPLIINRAFTFDDDDRAVINNDVHFNVPFTSTGLWELDGRLLGSASLSLLSGRLEWDGGEIALPVSGEAGVEINLNGGSLRLSDRLSSNGTVNQNGSLLDVSGGQVINRGDWFLNSGAILLRNGGLGLDNEGQLEVSQAGNIFRGAGDIVNSGSLVNASGGIITVDNELFNKGTLAGNGEFEFAGGWAQEGKIAPGLSPGILGVNTLEMVGESSLDIEIGGAQGPGPGHDLLTITEAANLRGTLNVSLLNGYVPSPGDRFLIMQSVNGNVDGAFDEANFPLNAAGWDISYEGSDVFLEILSALPLEMTNFTARALPKSNLLEWTTAWEDNTAVHHIERQVPGATWRSIGQVLARGFTEETTTYRWEDLSLPTEAHYRIRTVDFDGHASVSSILHLARTVEPAVSVFPNPTAEFITVDFPPSVSGATLVEVFNTLGQLVYRTTVTDRNQQIDLPVELSDGRYLLRVANLPAVPFVVQR